jgi:hypothetical protein
MNTMACDLKGRFVDVIEQMKASGEGKKIKHKCTKTFEKQLDDFEKNSGDYTDYSFYLIKLLIKKFKYEEAINKITSEERYMKANVEVGECKHDKNYISALKKGKKIAAKKLAEKEAKEKLAKETKAENEEKK